MRFARYGRRPDDNDDDDVFARIHHRAVHDLAIDIDDRHRAADLDYFHNEDHAAADYDHQSRQYDNVELRVEHEPDVARSPVRRGRQG
jgi:hypothetical protein